MRESSDKPDVATDPHPSGPPPWTPAYPGQPPPQELVEAVLAQDKQRLEQIHDPNLQVMVLKLAEAARQSTTELERFLAQTDALMNYANNSLALLRELDLLKPVRGGLIALQDYNAGSDAKLRVLRGKAPNKTNAKRPSAARVRALIRLFVHVLMDGGLKEIEAEKKVANCATDNGLKRKRLGAHGICVAIDEGEDEIGAAQFEVLKARLPAKVRRGSQNQRLAWVKRAATIFRKLEN